MRPESIDRQPNRALVFYGGFRRRGGGAYMHAMAIEKELSAMGWQVNVVCLDSLPMLLRYFPHLVERAVNLLTMPLGFYYKGRVTRFLYRQFFRQRAELYLFEDIYLAWNVTAPAVTILHAVWSDNLQAFPVTEAQTQRLVRKEANAIAGIAHPVVTVSQRYRKFLEQIHFAHAPLASPMEVIELGLDTSRFPASRRPFRSRSLVYCGALEPRKNVHFMLKVFARVVAADPSASLTIIGDGPDHANLKGEASFMGLNVDFKGRLTHEQVISELQRHTFYLHTSTKESFSYSLLEAKLCGLRTFALADLEVPEVFIDEGFADLDADEWAARILNIATLPDTTNFPDFSVRRMVDRTLQMAGWSPSMSSSLR